MQCIQNPEIAPIAIIEACKSQGALSSLDMPEYGIRPMSLNTFKTHCDNNSDILWQQMDASRKATLIKYNNYKNNINKPSRGTKIDLENRIAEINRELQLQNNDIIKFVDRYQDLLTICRDHALKDSVMSAKLSLHLKKYRYMENQNKRLTLKVVYGKRIE
jgi:hypothetical protein